MILRPAGDSRTIIDGDKRRRANRLTESTCD